MGTEDDEGDWVTIRAGWGSYRVRAGSLIAQALDPEQLAREQVEQVERGRMRWSLGNELADLFWMLVPESRPILAELAGKEFAEAVRYDRFLEPLGYAPVADELYLELLQPAMADLGTHGDLVRRCLAVLRRAIVEADGDVRWETLDRNIVRMLEMEGYAGALAELDPEFVALVRANRGG